MRLARVRWILVTSAAWALATVAGCNIDPGAPADPEPPTEAPAPFETDDAAPTTEGPDDGVGSMDVDERPPDDGEVVLDPVEQFVSDDLAGFAVAGEGFGAVDLRDLPVGTQIVFTIPDNGPAARTRKLARHGCTCAWSVQSLDGDDFEAIGLP